MVVLPDDFGQLLRSFRVRAGLTQQQLAGRSGVGLRTLQDLERGRVRRPQPRSVDRVVAALGLPPADRDRLQAAAQVMPSPAERGRLWVGVLGSLAVHRDGVPVQLGGPKLRCLSGLLAVQPGRAVSHDEIVEVLWGAAPPAEYPNLIQVYVRRLRRLMEPGSDRGSGFRVVVRAGGGYRLDLDVAESDLLTFDDLVGQARRADADGHPESAEQLLASALDCWRGPVLGASEPRLLQHPAVVAAAARRVEAALGYAEAATDAGHPGRAAARLRQVAAYEPLHEGLHARLMVALAADGQQAAALQVFQAIRGVLDADLGIGPGAELSAAQERVLRQQVPATGSTAAAAGDEARTGAAAIVDAAAATSVPPAQLPADVAGFTGRRWHLDELDRLAGDGAGHARRSSAVVVSAVDGTAGVGKTALAVHWAHRVRERFPDGQLYVNLRGYSAGPPVRPVEALAGFLHALGVAPENVPVHTDEAAGLYRSLLADRRVLVLLDNAADAEQVRPLLPGAPGCLVLVTSRDRVPGLVARDGATRLTLEVLIDAEARALLERLIGAARVRAEPEAADELARACAFLPLALRIAAANLLERPEPGIAGYLAELAAGDRLAALAVEGDESTAVRAAFDLSYARLDPEARRMFRLLGLVPGPDVTAEAAAALADVSAQQAGALLDRLTRVHLLDQHALDRYTSHDLLRLYATERATAEDGPADRDAALRRLYRYYQDRADASATVLYPELFRLPSPPPESNRYIADPNEALAWLDAERPNLMAVITATAASGPHQTAWRLGDAMRGYFQIRMHAVDWLTAARAALAAARAQENPQAEAGAQLSLGAYYWYQGRYRHAIDAYTAMHALARKADWSEGQAAALTNLGGLRAMVGELERAATDLDQALALQLRNDWRTGQAISLSNLGLVQWELGNLQRAADYFARALSLHLTTNSARGKAQAFMDLGDTYSLMGEFDQALIYLRNALVLQREIGSKTGEAETLSSIAEVECSTGRHDTAQKTAETALAVARESGYSLNEAQAFVALSVAQCQQHDHAALDSARNALRIARDTGHRYAEVKAILSLAYALSDLDRRRSASTAAHHALTLARQNRFRLLEGQALTTLASIHHKDGDNELAAHHARQALIIHEQTGHRPGAARTRILLGDTAQNTDHADALKERSLRPL